MEKTITISKAWQRFLKPANMARLKIIIVTLIACGLIAGCGFTKPNPNDLKKSPCACGESTTRQG